MSARTIDLQHPKELAFLFEPHRGKIAHGGRGGTKSWGFSRALIIKGWEKKLRILCAREIQKSIKQSVHQLLKDQIELLGLEDFYEVLQHEIRGKNGTLFSFTGLSSETASSIKSYEGYDIFGLEEAATVTRRSYDILMPTIRKEGSEIWITFNDELDTDETYVRFVENTPDDYVVVRVGWETNPWFPETLDKERKTFLKSVKAGIRRQDEYDNIWGGKCRPAVEGAVYAPECAAVIEDCRLTDVPYNSRFPVYTIWDLGWADSMAIGFVQVIGGSIRVIDYIEDNFRTYDSYYVEINEKKYNLGTSWLPHDGKNHNPQTGQSSIKTLQNLGLKVSDEPIEDIGFKEGMRLARMMFKRCWFDKKKCSPLFNSLRRYAFKVGVDTEEPTSIKKDANCHGADMFRYVAVVEAELCEDRPRTKDPYEGFRSGYAA